MEIFSLLFTSPEPIPPLIVFSAPLPSSAIDEAVEEEVLLRFSEVQYLPPPLLLPESGV